jgi:Lar family restriction alleviation protein
MNDKMTRRFFLKGSALAGAAAVTVPALSIASAMRDDKNEMIPLTLAQCPFCGSRRIDMKSAGKKKQVVCNNCGARTRETSDENEAARRWNVRESLYETVQSIRKDMDSLKKG